MMVIQRNRYKLKNLSRGNNYSVVSTLANECILLRLLTRSGGGKGFRWRKIRNTRDQVLALVLSPEPHAHTEGFL